MKKILFSFTLLMMLAMSGHAQYWLTLMPVTKNSEPKFQDYSNAFYDYWNDHEMEKGQAYKHFKRMEWITSPRLDENGNVPSALYYEQIEKLERSRNLKDDSWGEWTNLGPDYTPYWWQQNRLSGSGRLDCVEFHPNDTNTIWVGAHSGGFWKTTDGGQSWYTTTDHLPSIGISSIVIHPENPDVLYIGTGDRDSFVAFGVGVLKSEDGGETWAQTGLIYELPQNNIVCKLLIHPLYPEILYAATNQGIFKTSDDAVSWELLKQGHYKDIHFKEDDYNVMFCTSYNPYGNVRIYKSDDAGESWIAKGTDIITPSQVCRIALATTAANPEVIYAICSRKYPSSNLYGVYRSADAGETWQQTLSGDDMNLLGRSAYGADTEGYGWYTLTIAASPTNENIIFTGGINLWKSVNGGYDWQILTHETPGTQNTYNTWVDYHALHFRKNTDRLFCCHDGGIIKTYDHGLSFGNISDGLSILQIYKIGLSATNDDLALCGPQDQFTMYRQNETDWNCIYYGESGENFFDYSDEQTFYVSGYGGGFRRTTNGGGNFSNITPQGVSFLNWLAPFLIHPTDPNTIYVGINDVYRSHNQGTSWDKISENLSSSSQLTILKIADSDPDVMVTGRANALWRTKNDGQDWDLISGTFPGLKITEVCISSADAGHFYVTFGGFNEDVKVYKSTDYGDNWENITMNLPNVPATSIVYQNNTDNAVYVGTDLGIFYYCDALDEWIDFGNGLPNVVLGELEINHVSGKIKAGTYGRGLWESPLMDPNILKVETTDDFEMYAWPNPVKDILYVKLKSNNSRVKISVSSLAGVAVYNTNVDADKLALEQKLDLSKLSTGIYMLTIDTGARIITQKIVKL